MSLCKQQGAAWSALLLLSAPAMAQTATTSVRGLVTDPSGAIVSNATVVLSAPQIGITTQMSASDKGEYTFSEVTPGRYTVRVTAPGFEEATTAVELLVNQPTTVNVTLQISADVSVLPRMKDSGLLRTRL